MGVRLLTFTAATGASDAVHARLDALGAVKAGRWRTHAVFLHPRNESNGLSDLFMVHFDEQPHAQYLISGSVVMEAGTDIVGVVERVRAHAQRLKVTAEGSVYRCGDFTVRLGPLFLNENLSGTCCEIEYLPCSAAAGGAGLLKEFLERILPADARDSIWRSSAGDRAGDLEASPALPTQFGHEHAACQFVGLMRARLLPGSQEGRQPASKRGRGE